MDVDSVLERLGTQMQKQKSEVDSEGAGVEQGLYTGRGKGAAVAIGRDGSVQVIALATGATLLVAPVVLVTVKVLATPPTVALFAASSASPIGPNATGGTGIATATHHNTPSAAAAVNPAATITTSSAASILSGATGLTATTSARSAKVHFQLVTPSAQLPMFALSMPHFQRLRSDLETARQNVLTNATTTASTSASGTQVNSSSISSNYPNYNNNYAFNYSSNNIHRHSFDAGALSISPGVALLEYLKLTDKSNARCGGCGRRNPNWAAVQKILLITLVVCDFFEDKKSDIYISISKASNMTACLELLQASSDLSKMRLFFQTPETDEFLIEDDSDNEGPPYMNIHHAADNNLNFDYTYMPATTTPPNVGNRSRIESSPIMPRRPSPIPSASIMTGTTRDTRGDGSSKGKSKLQDSLLRTQNGILKLISGRNSNTELRRKSTNKSVDSGTSNSTGSSMHQMGDRATTISADAVISRKNSGSHGGLTFFGSGTSSVIGSSGGGDGSGGGGDSSSLRRRNSYSSIQGGRAGTGGASGSSSNSILTNFLNFGGSHTGRNGDSGVEPARSATARSATRLDAPAVDSQQTPLSLATAMLVVDQARLTPTVVLGEHNAPNSGGEIEHQIQQQKIGSGSHREEQQVVSRGNSIKESMRKLSLKARIAKTVLPGSSSGVGDGS
ncbi:hypothetical protein HK100_012361 [Physocladia obscura]|uniref:Uncharacterized protein n=1 Tax=Physocladia obscura TaxID=109957 RepID=A0AAD5SZY3_9FUNG|nr:hypothetical protein HK100_012361 [Physocladia obscura]